MNLSTTLAVAGGGAVGSIVRYVLGHHIQKILGYTFPFHTLIVNVLGSFAIGVLVVIFAKHGSLSSDTQTFWTTGFLGGFTTFSAFSLDLVLLLKKKAYLSAGAYGSLSLGLSLLGLIIGMKLVDAFFSSKLP